MGGGEGRRGEASLTPVFFKGQLNIPRCLNSAVCKAWALDGILRPSPTLISFRKVCFDLGLWSFVSFKFNIHAIFPKKSIPLCPLVFGETTSAPSAVLSPCCSKSIIPNFARLLVFLVVFIRGETQRAPQRLESVTLRDTKERETWRDFRDIWRDTELKRDVYQINKVIRMHLEILEDCDRWKEMTLEQGEICRKKRRESLRSRRHPEKRKTDRKVQRQGENFIPHIEVSCKPSPS